MSRDRTIECDRAGVTNTCPATFDGHEEDLRPSSSPAPHRRGHSRRAADPARAAGVADSADLSSAGAVLSGRQGEEGLLLAPVQRPAGPPALLVDALGQGELSKGMQGLSIRIAKALNGHWCRRRGSVFAERYFARHLRKVVEIWRAIRYVLSNGRKHGCWRDPRRPDPYSSGRWFKGWGESEGWTRRLRKPPLGTPLIYESTIWRNFGPIGIAEVPGAAREGWNCSAGEAWLRESRRRARPGGSLGGGLRWGRAEGGRRPGRPVLRRRPGRPGPRGTCP